MNVKVIALALVGAGAAAYGISHRGVLTAAVQSATGQNRVELMSYVPADTPFLFGTLEPMPEAARARFKAITEPYAEVMTDAFRAGFLEQQRKSLEKLSDAADKDAMLQTSEQMMTSLAGLGKIFTDDEEAVKAGFTARLNGVFYGVGMIPVLRVELSDEARALATFEKLFADAEKANRMDYENRKKLPREEGAEPLKPYEPLKIKSEAFRSGKMLHLGNNADAHLVMIFENKQLLITMVPVKLPNNYMDQVAPKAPLGKASALTAKLSGLKAKGFTGYMLGYLESQPMMRFAFGQRSAAETALYGNEQAKTMSAECKTELDGMAKNFPRLIMGTGVFNGDVMESKALFELAPAIAKDYQAVTTPIPGYGAGKAMRFSMALDLMKSVNLWRKQAQQIVDAPYKCELFNDLNDGAKKAVENLSNPGIGMISMYRGFGFALEDFQMEFPNGAATPEPKSFAGTAAIFADQPIMALGLLQMRMPELAKLNVKDDGVPVAIPTEMLAGAEKLLQGSEAYVAMNKQMVVTALGGSAKANIQTALKSSSAPNGTVMEFTYGGPFLKTISELQLKAAELETGAESASQREILKKIVAAQNKTLSQLNSAGMTMSFTAAGVEMKSATVFNKR